MKSRLEQLIKDINRSLAKCKHLDTDYQIVKSHLIPALREILAYHGGNASPEVKCKRFLKNYSFQYLVEDKRLRVFHFYEHLIDEPNYLTAFGKKINRVLEEIDFDSLAFYDDSSIEHFSLELKPPVDKIIPFDSSFTFYTQSLDKIKFP